jgi:hypothetical protein
MQSRHVCKVQLPAIPKENNQAKQSKAKLNTKGWLLALWYARRALMVYTIFAMIMAVAVAISAKHT